MKIDLRFFIKADLDDQLVLSGVPASGELLDVNDLNVQPLAKGGTRKDCFVTRFFDCVTRSKEQKQAFEDAKDAFMNSVADWYGDTIAACIRAKMERHLSQGSPLTGRRACLLIRNAENLYKACSSLLPLDKRKSMREKQGLDISDIYNLQFEFSSAAAQKKSPFTVQQRIAQAEQVVKQLQDLKEKASHIVHWDEYLSFREEFSNYVRSQEMIEWAVSFPNSTINKTIQQIKKHLFSFKKEHIQSLRDQATELEDYASTVEASANKWGVGGNDWGNLKIASFELRLQAHSLQLEALGKEIKP